MAARCAREASDPLPCSLARGRGPAPSSRTAAGSGTAAAGSDLVSVVGSTPEGEWLRAAVDPDLKVEDDEDRAEVVKLIRISMACCETNVDSRWELKTAVDRIEELKAADRASEDQSFYSSVNDEEDLNDVAIN